MRGILVRSESRYLINRKAIRERIGKILAENKIVGKTEVSVAIVGNRKMKALNKKHRQIEETTPVLAFPLEDLGIGHPELGSGSQGTRIPKQVRNDKRFPSPFSSPDEVLRLGDIVISYPQAVKMAACEEKLVDEKINELVEHGMRKLLGA